MIRVLLRRFLTIPAVMIVVNMIGYLFGFYLGPTLSSAGMTGFRISQLPPFLPTYFNYLKGMLSLNFGVLPNGRSVLDAIGQAFLASTGLLIVSFVLSILFGYLLGRSGVRSEPNRVATWLTVLSTFGQSSPSFYIGVLFISASVMLILWGPKNLPVLPFQGFGWDAHMILPVLALMIRPTLQIAHFTASLLVTEMNKTYTLVLQGMGFKKRTILGKQAFRNILAPVILVFAGSWRLILVELIILERLFNWPGLGKLLCDTLIRSSNSSYFLFPPLLAGLLSALAFLFMTADFLAWVLSRSMDPRLAIE
jgi:peptide/nickel transport system permease protein